MQYPTDPGHSYMTTELAEALVAGGCEVEILLLDWSARPGGAPERFEAAGGVVGVRCRPRALEGLGALAYGASKFVMSGLHAGRTARRRIDFRRIDAVIAWSPALAFAPVLDAAGRAGVPHRLLFIWDFFPDHHRQIGRIPPGPATWAARAWEARQLRRFTTIFCTLPGNAAYLRRNFRLRPGQKVVTTPIWTDPRARPAADAAATRRRLGLPADRPIAVFGGQLVEGRGFGQMLSAAEAGETAGSSLLYLFVGEGRLAPMLRAAAEAQPNVAWRPPLPREAYLDLLGACDVGMAATVPGVTSFSIPSKTLDYLRAGLPVVAAVEHGNDFAEILSAYGVGEAVAFGDAAGFHGAAERLAVSPGSRAAARAGTARCLDEVFDVRHAAARVMEAVGAQAIEGVSAPRLRRKARVTSAAIAP